MKTWRVTGVVMGSKYLGTVKGKDKEEALDNAEHLCGPLQLCHQCSGECEGAQIDVVEVEEDV